MTLRSYSLPLRPSLALVKTPTHTPPPRPRAHTPPLPIPSNYNCSYFHPCTPRQLPQAPPPTPSTSLGSIKATNRQGASGHHGGGVRESVCDDYGRIAAERPGRSTCLAGAQPRPQPPGSVAFPGWGGGRGTWNGGRTKRALWIEWTPNRDPPSCHQTPFVDGRRLAVTQPPPVLQRKKRVSRIVMQTKAGPIRSGEAVTGVEVGGKKKKITGRKDRRGPGRSHRGGGGGSGSTLVIEPGDSGGRPHRAQSR